MNISVLLATVSESHLESSQAMPFRCYTAAADRTHRTRVLGNGKWPSKKGVNRGPIMSVMQAVHFRSSTWDRP